MTRPRTRAELINTLRVRPLASHELAPAEWTALEELERRGLAREVWRPGRSWVLLPQPQQPAPLEEPVEASPGEDDCLLWRLPDLGPPPAPRPAPRLELPHRPAPELPRIALTAMQRGAILRLHQQGRTLRQIAAEIGCDTGAVRRFIRRAEARGFASTPAKASTSTTRAAEAPTPEEYPMAALSNAERQQIINLRQKGKTVTEIASKTGRSMSCVFNALELAESKGTVFPEVSRPGRPGDPERDARIAAAVAGGATLKQAAEAEGVTTSTAKRAVDKASTAAATPPPVPLSELSRAVEEVEASTPEEAPLEEVLEEAPPEEAPEEAPPAPPAPQAMPAPLSREERRAAKASLAPPEPCGHEIVLAAAAELLGLGGLNPAPAALVYGLATLRTSFERAAKEADARHDALLAAAARESAAHLARTVEEVRASSDRAQAELQQQIDQLLLGITEACERADAADALRDQAGRREEEATAAAAAAATRAEEVGAALLAWGERLGAWLGEHEITPAEGEDALAAASRAIEELRQGASEAAEAATLARRQLAESLAREASTEEVEDLRRRLDESLAAEASLGRDLAAAEAELTAARAWRENNEVTLLQAGLDAAALQMGKDRLESDLEALREEYASVCADLAAFREIHDAACCARNAARDAAGDLRAQLDAAHAARDAATEEVADLARRLTLEEAARTVAQRVASEAESLRAEAQRGFSEAWLEAEGLRLEMEELRLEMEELRRQLASRSDDGIYREAWDSERRLRQAEWHAIAADRQRQRIARDLEEAQRGLEEALVLRDAALARAAEVEARIPPVAFSGVLNGAEVTQ